MKKSITLSVVVAAFAVSGCVGDKQNKTIDRGFDTKHLSQLKAGIWVDPTGCDHWIIDDGLEGYLSARLDDRGKPVCSGVAAPNTAVGGVKSGSTFPDIL